jgi:hypothetical protein
LRTSTPIWPRSSPETPDPCMASALGVLFSTSLKLELQAM